MACKKFTGGDCELSTSGAMRDGTTLQPWDATRRVLAHADAAFLPRGGRTWSRQPPARDAAWPYQGNGASAWSSDCLRHWATNGQAYYSDMGHVEVCTAEALDARTYAAGTIANLLAVETARRQAEQAADDQVDLTLTTHNVDWQDASISWGTHFNVAVERALWDGLFREIDRPAVLGSVASGVAAAIVFFGGGYLLPLADGTIVYSLSGRAHHLAKLSTLATTEKFRRGILNSRDEPHAADAARMHLIGFDLAPASLALRCVFVQCLLAAAEEGFCGGNLSEPVHALRSWSWGLDLNSGRPTSTAQLVDGRRLTLAQYVAEMARLLLAMAESGLIPDRVVPGAQALLPIVIELCGRCEAGELAACAKHLDWAAKLMVLIQLCGGPGVRLGDAVTRLADQDYGNTDPSRGWFWRLWQDGAIDPLVSRSHAEDLLDDGPAEGRGWARGRIIRHMPAEAIADVNWSFVDLRRSAQRWSSRLKVDMPRLESLNRGEFESIITLAAGVDDLERLLLKGPSQAAGRRDPLMEIESQLAPALPRVMENFGSLNDP